MHVESTEMGDYFQLNGHWVSMQKETSLQNTREENLFKSNYRLFYMSEREVRPEVPLDHLIQQQCGSHPAARIHES